jgi:hypothetical protein
VPSRRTLPRSIIWDCPSPHFPTPPAAEGMTLSLGTYPPARPSQHHQRLNPSSRGLPVSGFNGPISSGQGD